MASVATLDYRAAPASTSRLEQQLEERDEIIVALQHVILDLRHEIENLRCERTYEAFAVSR